MLTFVRDFVSTWKGPSSSVQSVSRIYMSLDFRSNIVIFESLLTICNMNNKFWLTLSLLTEIGSRVLNQTTMIKFSLSISMIYTVEVFFKYVNLCDGLVVLKDWQWSGDNVNGSVRKKFEKFWKMRQIRDATSFYVCVGCLKSFRRKKCI